MRAGGWCVLLWVLWLLPGSVLAQEGSEPEDPVALEPSLVDPKSGRGSEGGPNAEYRKSSRYGWFRYKNGNLVSPADSKVRRVGVAIRGGISLGTYQAGMLWALGKELNQSSRAYFERSRVVSQQDEPQAGPGALFEDEPEIELLTTVAGTSAGTINAYALATEACRKNYPESPWESIFWSTWGYLDFWTTLYPYLENRDDALIGRIVDDPRHALLNRSKGTEYAIKRLEKLWDAPETFREGCKVRVVSTLTKLQTTPLPDAPEPPDGSALESERREFNEASNLSTFAVVTGFDLFTNPDGTLGFNVYSPSIGDKCTEELALWVTPYMGHTRVSELETITSIIRASSAFPVAFALVDIKAAAIKICRGGKWIDYLPKEDYERATALNAFNSIKYYDGGAHDTMPVGLLLDHAMGETAKGSHDHTKKDTKEGSYHHYIITTENTGGVQAFGLGTRLSLANSRGAMISENSDQMKAVGLSSLITLAQEFFNNSYVRTASRTALRHSKRFYDRESMTYPRRVHKVYGAMLGAFAAFLSHAWREYDYLVGVYDGATMLGCRLDEQGPLEKESPDCKAFIRLDEELTKSELSVLRMLNVVATRDLDTWTRDAAVCVKGSCSTGLEAAAQLMLDAMHDEARGLMGYQQLEPREFIAGYVIPFESYFADFKSIGPRAYSTRFCNYQNTAALTGETPTEPQTLEEACKKDFNRGEKSFFWVPAARLDWTLKDLTLKLSEIEAQKAANYSYKSAVDTLLSLQTVFHSRSPRPKIRNVGDTVQGIYGWRRTFQQSSIPIRPGWLNRIARGGSILVPDVGFVHSARGIEVPYTRRLGLRLEWFTRTGLNLESQSGTRTSIPRTFLTPALALDIERGKPRRSKEVDLMLGAEIGRAVGGGLGSYERFGVRDAYLLRWLAVSAQGGVVLGLNSLSQDNESGAYRGWEGSFRLTFLDKVTLGLGSRKLKSEWQPTVYLGLHDAPGLAYFIRDLVTAGR